MRYFIRQSESVRRGNGFQFACLIPQSFCFKTDIVEIRIDVILIDVDERLSMNFTQITIAEELNA